MTTTTRIAGALIAASVSMLLVPGAAHAQPPNSSGAATCTVVPGQPSGPGVPEVDSGTVLPQPYGPQGPGDYMCLNGVWILVRPWFPVYNAPTPPAPTPMPYPVTGLRSTATTATAVR